MGAELDALRQRSYSENRKKMFLRHLNFKPNSRGRLSMDSVNFDFSKFHQEAAKLNGNDSKLDEIKKLSMIAIKLSNETISSIKSLTTEGMESLERKNHVDRISQRLESDIFEFSTCNRVLYVGFGVPVQELEKAVLQESNLSTAPFEKFQGMDVWRYLVKVCSGLDSFIMGELQVMGQFRGAVSWHRKNGLIGDMNASFFDHVIAANRVVRKELGFTKTTESMLSLATTAIEESMIAGHNSTVTVVGYGDMGRKAAEVLTDLGYKGITVVTRSPSKAAARTPDNSQKIKFIEFKKWDSTDKPQLIISTIRNTNATFNEHRPLPVTVQTRILDFSWPPSVDESGIHDGQILLDMKHWIRTAHKMEITWDYEKTINTGEKIISEIEERFQRVLVDKNQAAFRSFIYARLESMSSDWESLDNKNQQAVQMTAFSREIATWICNQKGEFHQDDLHKKVTETDRNISPSTLELIASDVIREMIRINSSDKLPEVMA